MKKYYMPFLATMLIMIITGGHLISQTDQFTNDNQGDLKIRKVLVLPQLDYYSDTINFILEEYMRSTMDAESDDRIRFYSLNEVSLKYCTDLSEISLPEAEVNSILELGKKAKLISGNSGRLDAPGKEDYDVNIFAQIGKICNVDAVLTGALYNYKVGETARMGDTPKLKSKGWVSFGLIDTKSSSILWMGTGKSKETQSMTLQNINLDNILWGTRTYHGYYPEESVVIGGAFDDIAKDFPYKNHILTKEEASFLENYLQKKDEKVISNALAKNPKLINTKDDLGNTLLHYTTKNNDLENIKTLISKGAFVNAKNNIGETPLMYSVKFNQSQSAKLLLENKAEVDGINEEGQPAIFYAIENKNLEMVKLLTNNKATINFADRSGNTPIIIASAKDSCSQIVEYLYAQKADINLKNCDGNDALMESAKFGAVGNGKFLLKNGVGIEGRNLCGNTPIIIAVENGLLPFVKMLKENKVNINAQNDIGITALHCAVDSLEVEIFDFLIAQPEIHVNLVDSLGMSPLYYASLNDELHMTNKLLEKGADPNLCDHTNTSPLNIACMKPPNYEIANSLLKYKADPNIMSNDTLYPLMQACINGSLEVTKLLVEYGAEMYFDAFFGTSPLMLAAINNNLEIIDYLLTKNIDVNLSNKEDHSALTYAITGGNIEAAMRLVNDSRINLNQKNKEGNTPFMLALGDNKNKELLTKMLEKGIDLKLRNNEGATSLMLTSGKWYALDLVKTMVSQGAEINALDNNRKTAMDYAKSSGGGKISKFLKTSGGLSGKKIKS